MKRLMTFIFSLFLLMLAVLPGCAQTGVLVDGKPSIVCTIFPQYDWTRQILGGKAEEMDLTLLLNNGIDLHSFQPTVDDIVRISACDLFIYVGGESDAWVEDALNQAENPDMAVINLLETLGDGAKAEEIIEGMEDGEAHDHEEQNENTEHQDESGHKDTAVYDEHVWLSLSNAKTFCEAITGALSSLDSDNADEYHKNLTAYIEALDSLDGKYRSAAGAAPVKALLFGDRFPFRYLADDYGLSYHAAFPGCSAETEASFETIMFLSNKTDELDLNTIMVTESADQAIAETIIGSTRQQNQQIRVLNALQSVSLEDIDNGVTYLSIMESNLNTLIDSLR